MLLTDSRQYGEHGDRSKIVPSWALSLKRGVTRAIFHLVGKRPLCIDKLINLVNGCAKTGETSFRTFTLISSAPVAFEDDKLPIKF